MSQRRAGGRGRPHKLPGVEAPSKLKRVCGAEGCEVQVVGTELPYHYKARTDFEKLGELRRLPEEMAEERLKDLDPHTVYMFRKKHTSLNLPKWNTHKPVPKSVPQAFRKKDLNENTEENRAEENNEEKNIEEENNEDEHRNAK